MISCSSFESGSEASWRNCVLQMRVVLVVGVYV
jgi:hypothetical protein